MLVSSLGVKNSGMEPKSHVEVSRLGRRKFVLQVGERLWKSVHLQTCSLAHLLIHVSYSVVDRLSGAHGWRLSSLLSSGTEGGLLLLGG